jgi:hypothetical protein
MHRCIPKNIGGINKTPIFIKKMGIVRIKIGWLPGGIAVNGSNSSLNQLSLQMPFVQLDQIDSHCHHMLEPNLHPTRVWIQIQISLHGCSNDKNFHDVKHSIPLSVGLSCTVVARRAPVIRPALAGLRRMESRKLKAKSIFIRKNLNRFRSRYDYRQK